MLFQKLALVSAIAATVSAQDVDNNDLPQQCRAICASLVSASQQCDNQTNDDAAELSCVCNSANASTVIPACDACVAQFSTNNDPNDANDVRELLTRCSLSTTTYNSASASQLLSSLSNTPAATSGSVVVTTSGTVVITTSVAPQTSGVNSAAATATGAAPGQTAAAGAALGLGVFGVAVGLL